ncbi:MAG: tetratricopeptide repeat protein [Aureliella sp.]
MQLDPTKWFVDFAGFFYDWMLTRQWTKVLLGLFPLVLVVATLGFVWYGRTQSKQELASWYMKLGEAEVEEWTETWTGTAESPSDDESDAEAVETAEKNRISPYADMLFRRVESLIPSDRSRFYIAMSMLQQGAAEESREMLAEIAPDDKAGLPEAHAFLALMRMSEGPQGKDPRETIPMLRHHITEGIKAKRVPLQLLTSGSQFFYECAKNWSRGDAAIRRDKNMALNLMQSAAEIDPQYSLRLGSLAAKVGNALVVQDAYPEAEEYFREKLAEEPKNDSYRIQLAESLRAQGKVEEAETLLKEGMAAGESDKLRRALSELYRYLYRLEIQNKGGVDTNTVRYLDAAYRCDPSNPMIGEEISRLARANSRAASKELIEKLKKFLGSGTATPVTHRLLAEARIVRGELEAAIPHLEQVVMRDRNEIESRNNLAFIYGEFRPEKLDQAIALSLQAIDIANRLGESKADFYDTLGTLYGKKKNSTAAIAAFEKAIEMDPERTDFRERLAEQYRAIGDESMATIQEEYIEQLKEAEEKKKLEEAAAEAAAAESVATEGDTSVPEIELTTPTSGATSTETERSSSNTPGGDSSAPQNQSDGADS